MKKEKLEIKLNELKEKYKKEEEVWINLPGYKNYQVSTFGRIKSLDTIERRISPRTGKMSKFLRKETILRPLFTGENGKWVSIKLSVKQGIHKQSSIAKLLLSAILNVKLEKLPHSVYFINCDSHDVKLHNLTFIYANKENKQ